jgi:probable phosphoglycerate mutase
MKTDDIPVLQQPFYFLRHGETESNLNDTTAGWLDVPLTPRGREQARMAAAILRGKSITAIYSSGLRRARDTAEAVAQSLGLPMTIIAALAERRWGELEGKPRAWRVPGVTPPGAETKDEFEKRIRYAFRQIKPGGLPLIVAHSGVYRVLCSILCILDPETRLPSARPVYVLPASTERPTATVKEEVAVS